MVVAARSQPKHPSAVSRGGRGYETEGHWFESSRARSYRERANRIPVRATTCIRSDYRLRRQKQRVTPPGWGDYRADLRAEATCELGDDRTVAQGRGINTARELVVRFEANCAPAFAPKLRPRLVGALAGEPYGGRPEEWSSVAPNVRHELYACGWMF
jgi:hypothetical protein